MDKLVMALATGFYTGYTPKAPGSMGTLVAFPIHFLIILLPGYGYYLALTAILVLAIITAGMAEKIIDRQDPGMVVIDEIIGMLIGLVGAPLTLPALVTAFILFRILISGNPSQCAGSTTISMVAQASSLMMSWPASIPWPACRDFPTSPFSKLTRNKPAPGQPLMSWPCLVSHSGCCPALPSQINLLKYRRF